MVKIIDKLKSNYRTGMERERIAKENREIIKKKLEGDYKRVIQLIKEESPTWADMDEDMLMLFIKLAMAKYPGAEREFENADDETIRQKIKNIFLQSEESRAITPDQIRQINAAYHMGKNLGMKPKHLLKSIFRKAMKQSKP
jgi:hypothetical protein